MRRHGNPSRRTLERLLAAAGSNLAEFEALRIGKAPSASHEQAGSLAERGSSWPSRGRGPLPLLAAGTPVAGDIAGLMAIDLPLDRIAGEVARPPSLASDRDAYAISIVGNAMWPRFRAVQLVAVSPLAAIGDGDDVLVRLRRPGGGNRAIVAHLVHRTPTALELRQFNPDVSSTLAMSEIAAVTRIIGELI